MCPSFAGSDSKSLISYTRGKKEIHPYYISPIEMRSFWMEIILIFVGPDKHARTNGRFFDRTEWDQKTPILAEAKPELGLEFVKRA